MIIIQCNESAWDTSKARQKIESDLPGSNRRPQDDYPLQSRALPTELRSVACHYACFHDLLNETWTAFRVMCRIIGRDGKFQVSTQRGTSEQAARQAVICRGFVI